MKTKTKIKETTKNIVQQDEPELQYSLKLAKELNFAAVDININDILNNENSLKFDYSFVVTYDQELKCLEIKFNFRYFYQKAETLDLFCKIETLFEFQLINVRNEIVVSDGSIKINLYLIETLLSNVIQTTRGILLSRTSGYQLNKLYLPFIDVKEVKLDKIFIK